MDAAGAAGAANDYSLHRLVFLDNTSGLKDALEAQKPHPGVDVLFRGQTPLTLAIALGRKACVQLLLDGGASVMLKNSQGWDPFQEAISYGDRETIRSVFLKRREYFQLWFEDKGKKLLQDLSTDIKDFYLEIHWQFKSWVPFLSSFCPSDTYKIYKKGTSVRVDTTLVGFEGFSWVRGKLSIIFFGDSDNGEPRLVICDRERKVVQQLYPRDVAISEKEIEEEISLGLNSPQFSAPDVDIQGFKFSRAQTGFWNKCDRNERVGFYETQVWNLNQFQVHTMKRTEHLDANPKPSKHARSPADSCPPQHELEDMRLDSEETIADAPEETEVVNYIAKVARTSIELARDDDGLDWSNSHKVLAGSTPQIPYRPSLDPPEDAVQMSYQEYFDLGMKDRFVHLGRPLKVSTNSKTFKASLWMYDCDSEACRYIEDEKHRRMEVLGTESEDASDGASVHSYRTSDFIIPSLQSPDFPLQAKNIEPLFDLIGLSNNDDAHIQSLQSFFHSNLPKGFPVQLEIPIGMYPLSAMVTFQNIQTLKGRGQGDAEGFDIDDSVFDIPGEREGYSVGIVKSISGMPAA